MTREASRLSGNPMDVCPDDTVCYYCATKLPEIPVLEQECIVIPNEYYFPFEGFCNARCALLQLTKYKSPYYTADFIERIVKAGIKPERTALPLPDVIRNDLIADPSTSFWLRSALTKVRLRDPVDAARDAATLLYYCEARMQEAACQPKFA